MKNVGINIEKFRNSMRLTQDELADYLGIKSRNLISYYENGEREVPVEHLEKLADLFGVEVIALFEDPELTTANIAFAYCADQVTTADLGKIAKCKKIVLNYLKMLRLESKHEGS